MPVRCSGTSDRVDATVMLEWGSDGVNFIAANSIVNMIDNTKTQ